MIEKRVVAVIVEGQSDENAIGGILKEYFASEEVQFAVVHGDITSDEANTVDDVVKKVEETVDGIRGKYGYKWTDFVQVIHIADTDGAFTKDCVVGADTRDILYYEDHMESSNVDATIGLTMQNILSNDVDTIENSYFSQIPSMVFYVASFLFSLCTLLFMNWKMTILLWKII